MRILIAGGCGYVGSVLTEKLAKNHDVSVVDLCWFGNHLDGSIKVDKRDILDLDVEDLRGVDQVVFVAGYSNDPMAQFDPVGNFVQNAAVPIYLAYISKQAKVKRFIFASSCSVYGNTNGKMADEHYPATPEYPYGIAKLMAEDSLRRMVSEEFSVIILRKGTICGWSPRMRFDLLLNTMFMAAVKDRKIVVNNPHIHRPLLTMADAVHAYEKAVAAPPAVSGTYNITTGNYYVGEIAAGVARYFSHMSVKIETHERPDLRDYWVTSHKATSELHYMNSVPSVWEETRNLASHCFSPNSLCDGRGFPMPAIDFDDPAYHNIETLRRVSFDAAMKRKAVNFLRERIGLDGEEPRQAQVCCE